MGARITNHSWADGSSNHAFSDEVTRARNLGNLVIVAAGNSSRDNDSSPSYPAFYPADNVLSVSAIDHDGNMASFSNFGATSVDLAAPGVGIYSTVLNDGYD